MYGRRHVARLGSRGTGIVGMKNRSTAAAMCLAFILGACSSSSGGSSGTIPDGSPTPDLTMPPVTSPASTSVRSFTYQSKVYTLGGKGPGGGVVYYISETPFACGPELLDECNALEAAPTESEVRRGWAKTDLLEKGVDGADRTAIGTGYANTLDIMRQGSTDPAESGAAYAESYSHGGKDDWYLPSKEEFLEMFKQKELIGGFSIADYWSSSEVESVYAWSQFFFEGHPQLLHPKNHYTHYIRPVRSF